jgi:hypothetical protein
LCGWSKGLQQKLTFTLKWKWAAEKINNPQVNIEQGVQVTYSVDLTIDKLLSIYYSLLFLSEIFLFSSKNDKVMFSF